MTSKDQKHQKDNQQDKNKQESKKFIPPQKPFQQFSKPNKFSGSPPKSFNAFHRRLGK